MCSNERGHLWNSSIGVPSKVIECDWCVCCGIPRPGYMDPAVKAEKWKEDDAPKGTEVQGLHAVEAPPPGAVSGAPVHDAPPGEEEAA